MGQITILKNATGYIKPEIDFQDTGWVISGGIATHYPCNPGTMANISIQGLVVGRTYDIIYDVLNYGSGGVKAILGTTNGTTKSANITQFSENLVCAGNTTLSFYSDGFLSIANLVIFDEAQQSVPFTFCFNEKNKQWSHAQSFVPDMMLKYGNEFYSFKNGAAWKHNANPVRMNFYGQQYSAQITFVLNSERDTVKIPSNIIINSNNLWWVPNIAVKPYEGKSLGMQSRIKKGRMVRLQGIYWADFLRNMVDPRFTDQLQALLYGEELRGCVMTITIQNDDTDETILSKVEVEYSPQMLTP